MPKPTPTPDDNEESAAAAAAADLPFDLHREVSRHLHTTGNYVRFHAVCSRWRDTLPPPPCRPALLPWLLSPHNGGGRRTARCVFSASNRSGVRRRSVSAAAEISVQDRGWVVRSDDGTAAWLLTSNSSSDDPSGGGPDPLSQSAPVLHDPVVDFPVDEDSWDGFTAGVVYGDGTTFLHAIIPVGTAYYTPSYGAFRLPGSAAPWTFMHTSNLRLNSDRDANSWCFSYHRGRIVRCHGQAWCLKSAVQMPEPVPIPVVVGERRLKDEPGRKFQASYLFESRGQLLWAWVQLKTDSAYWSCPFGYLDDLARAWSVSLYALEDADGEKPGWVKMDGKSFSDRVLFLGRPNSFTVDAARVGMGGGDGCAYFVDRRKAHGNAWSKPPAHPLCRVFRYRFRDDRSELVDRLPAHWTDVACMWLTPQQPAIASNEEIRNKLARATQAPLFRIYVGNLPRTVDSHQLRQMFTKHGKVTHAKVMRNRKTRHSRGFGFVSMVAATADDEPAHVVAKLQGLSLEGRLLRVKLADQD